MVAAATAMGCGDADTPTPASLNDADASPDAASMVHDAGSDSEASEAEPEAESEAGSEASADAATDSADGGSLLTWGPCDTSTWPEGYPKPALGVECTTVLVPLDHAQPNGSQISLRVARDRSKAHPTGKAVFQLAGGPGGSSVNQTGIIPYYMPELRDEFDLVYVDQRGTGGSEYLDCKWGYPDTEQQWAACGQEHQSDPLNHYGTVDAAHDLDAVRGMLGYDKIYLRGGSYGTRLGLEYLRQHGDNTVAAVLDGLVPPNYPLFEEVIRNFDWGINRLVSDCEQSASCTALSPNLSDDLLSRRAQLKSQPRPIKVGGLAYSEDEMLYLLVLQYTVADAYWRFEVPHAIHAAVSGDNSLWNGLMGDVFGAAVTDGTTAGNLIMLSHPFTRGTSYVAPGLYASVACSEFLPLSGGTSALRALAEQQTWGNDTSEYSLIGLAEACSEWKVDPIDASLQQPVSSNVKTLLLSGAIDMTTTPNWGVEARKALPNATHIEVPYATHATMSVPCVGQIITRFLEADGDITAVDTSCVDALTEPAWERIEPGAENGAGHGWNSDIEAPIPSPSPSPEIG